MRRCFSGSVEPRTRTRTRSGRRPRLEGPGRQKYHEHPHESIGA